MIIDRIENLQICPLNENHRKMIMDFLARSQSEQLPAGRYDLDGNALFALIQMYEPKDKAEAMMESHILHADLQVILTGSEQMFWAYADELKVVEDRSTESDILFYENTAERCCFRIDAGTFAYFAPSDAHMPSIRLTANPASVKKIVFKIRL
jgi:YhcH/YjgK/YiaL family protein